MSNGKIAAILGSILVLVCVYVGYTMALLTSPHC